MNSVHALMESRIDEVSKWIEKSCSDSAKQKCNAIVVTATTNQAVAETEAQVANFITRDLVIFLRERFSVGRLVWQPLEHLLAVQLEQRLVGLLVRS